MWICCAGDAVREPALPSRCVSASSFFVPACRRGSVTNYDAGEVLTVHGGTPLHGRLRVRGAKNLVSKAMVAALLGEEPSRLRNVPEISDVAIVSGLLDLHGVTVERVGARGAQPGELVMDPRNVEQAHVADIDAHAGSSRVPILLCGPLLHRLGEAFIPDLGGWRIGGGQIN